MWRSDNAVPTHSAAVTLRGSLTMGQRLPMGLTDPQEWGHGAMMNEEEGAQRCPHHHSGERLLSRETWQEWLQGSEEPRAFPTV